MKTVLMHRDYSYRAKARVFVQYLAAQIYERTPEAAVRAIVAAQAGEIVDECKPDE